MSRPLDILLVEDNPGDVRLVREALDGLEIANRLRVARDGDTAIALLRQEGEFEAAHLPDLVLLDLDLPGRHGCEVLAEIKGDPRLRRIPVVIVTSSSAETDVLRSYDLHANCYVVKPRDWRQFAGTMRSIHDFWTSIVELPSAAGT